MTLKTLGEVLQEEREQRHVGLDELSQQTKIKRSYLEALEANRFSELPAAVYVRGYVRAYAEYLRVDPQPFVALLRRDFKEDHTGVLIPRELMSKSRGGQKYWTPVTLTMMAVVSLFVVVIGYVGVQWWRFTQPPPLVIEEPVENQVVAAQTVVSGTTRPDVILVINNQPVALRPDGSFETEIFLPNEGPASVTVEARDQRGKTRLIQRTVTVQF